MVQLNNSGQTIAAAPEMKTHVLNVNKQKESESRKQLELLPGSVEGNPAGLGLRSAGITRDHPHASPAAFSNDQNS